LTQVQSTSRSEGISLRRMYPSVTAEALVLTDRSIAESRSERQIKVPQYLTAHYWWAYVHPRAVWVFERQWLVNLILWGNYTRLRDAAMAELGKVLPGATLQVACVYGDLTGKLIDRVAAGGGRLDIVDVLPTQLENLRGKMPSNAPARLLAMDSADLEIADASYDRALLFFLLHEQPAAHRERTLSEVRHRRLRATALVASAALSVAALARRARTLRAGFMASRDQGFHARGGAGRMAPAVVLRRIVPESRDRALRRR
jgi:SAM-dependent methyltransferase